MLRFAVALLIVFSSCSHEVQDDSKNISDKKGKKEAVQSIEKEPNAELKTPDKKIWNKDSLIKVYEDYIVNFYKSQLAPEETFGSEIRIKGSLAFEDETLLILSFEEIIEFGSWQYSSSSIFLNKSGNTLRMVTGLPMVGPNGTNSENILYPGRVNGVFVKRTQLNGNENPDFIMESSVMYRTTEGITQRIYEFDAKSNTLKQFEIAAYSEITNGECSGAFGSKEELKVVDTKSDLPLLQIQKTISECLEDKAVIVKETHRQFQWDPAGNQFLEIK